MYRGGFFVCMTRSSYSKLKSVDKKFTFNLDNVDLMFTFN